MFDTRPPAAPPRPARRAPAAALAAAACAALLSSCGRPEGMARHPKPLGPEGGRWVITWAASPQPSDPGETLELDDQTIRQVVHVSIGGPGVRVRLSNAYGKAPLRVGAAHVALHAGGPSIAAGSDRALTFGGAAGVTIPPGAFVVSDPAQLSVPALADLAVSLHLPGRQAASTEHSTAVQTAYLSAGGDFTGSETFASAGTKESWYFVSGVEIAGAAGDRAVVAFGASITDGLGATADANRRWPDLLSRRMNAAGGPSRRAVANAGISGNRMLSDLVGVNGLSRLDRDVFAQPGVRYVIVDIGGNDSNATVDEIIAGHRQIALRAHALGIKAIGATLPPCEGKPSRALCTPEGNVKREAINAWLRRGEAYDGLIDFDRTIRDPSHPTRLLPAFDSGDHLHPNDAGYAAMANSIDLSLFDDPPE